MCCALINYHDVQFMFLMTNATCISISGPKRVSVYAASKHTRLPIIVGDGESQSLNVTSVRSRFESIVKTIESTMKHLDGIHSTQAKARVKRVLVQVKQITRMII